MEILNYQLASKRAQTPTLSHTDLLILSVFQCLITVCKSRSPAALNACIVTSPVPPFDPLGPLEGSTHTCQTLSVWTSVYTFTRTPWSLLETHTQTQERQRRPRHWGSTSTSGADWREGQWKHDQPIHFCSWVFFFFFDIPFLHICIIQSLLPIKAFSNERF